MNRLYTSITITLILILSLLPIYSGGEASGLDPIYLVSPKTGSPQVLSPGDTLEIVIQSKDEVSISQVNISMVYDDDGRLKYVEKALDIVSIESSMEGNLFLYNVKLLIPNNTVDGLYSIEVIFESGDGVSNILREPDSLWIDSETLDSLTFVQVSDIHIGFEYESNQRLVTALLMYRLLDPKPRLFVSTGDNTDRAANLEAIKLKELLSTFGYGIPKLLTPGNHDSRTKAYETHVGERYYYRVVGGNFLFIALDTGDFGMITYEQYIWLREVLEEYSNLTKIIFFHHPIWGYEIQGNITYEGVVRENELYGSWRSNMSLTKATLDLITEYRVNLVLAGHIHTDRTVTMKYDGGVTYFVTTTTLGASRPEYNGLRLITIFRNGSIILHNIPPWASFGKVPNSIPIQYLEDFKYGLDRRGTPGYPLFRGLYSMDGDSLSISMNIMSWLSLEGRLLLPIDTERDITDYNLYVSMAESSTATLIDSKRFDGINYFLVDITVDPGGELIFSLSYFNDEDPPNLSVAYINPEDPAPNVPITVYFDASDDGWGVYKVPVKVSIEKDDMQETMVLEAMFTGTLYMLSLEGYEGGTIIKLYPSALDFNLNYVNLSELEIMVEEPIEEVYIPDIRVVSLNVSSESIRLGESIDISIELSNFGNATGEYTLEIFLNGELFNSSVVTLDVGMSTIYTVTFTPDAAGTYTFEVDGFSATVNVVEEAIQPEEPIEEETTPPSSTIYLVGVVALIVTVSLVLFIVLRKR